MRIGQVARQAGVEASAIRYYESVGVLPPPPRTAAGYRDYTPQDAERVRFVSAARSLGLGLDDIKETLTLRAGGETPCTYVRSLIDREVDAVRAKILELEQLAAELETLQARAKELPDTSADEPCVCHIITT